MVTVVMALVSAVLGPVYGRGELTEDGLGLANTLFLVCLAIFIGVIGIGLLTAEHGAEQATEPDADRPGASKP